MTEANLMLETLFLNWQMIQKYIITQHLKDAVYWEILLPVAT